MASLRSDRALMALFAGFAVVIALVAGAAWLARYQQSAFASVDHTLQVENGLRKAFSGLQDAETGQRGYLLTRRTEFLEPYTAALSNLDRDFQEVECNLSDNPRQRARLEQLRTIARKRQEVLRTSVVLMQNGDRNAIDEQRLGAGRLLLGSDHPENLAVELAKHRVLGLSEGDLAACLGGTAAKVFGLAADAI
jgi:CHASE3 domain sensor protein